MTDVAPVDLAVSTAAYRPPATPAPALRPGDVPACDRPPFFVVGYVRSGTTLFRRMLSMHPDLYVLQELDEYQRIPQMLGRHGLPDAAALDAFIAALPIYYSKVVYDMDRFRELAAARLPLSTPATIAALKAAARASAGAKPGARWGHKEPHEWPFLYRLRDWYPDGQFLHIVRRPHDVVASAEHYRHIRLHSLPTTPLISVWHWRTSLRTVRRQGGTLPAARFLRLRYEDLIADTAGTLGQVVAMLNADPAFIPQMMEFYKTPLVGQKGEHMTRSKQPITQDEKSRGERSLSDRLKRDVDWICRREMALLGYAPLGDGAPSALRKLWLEAMCVGFSVVWAGMRASRRLRGRL